MLMLMNMPTLVGIFSYFQQRKFHVHLSLARKQSFITSGPGQEISILIILSEDAI